MDMIGSIADYSMTMSQSQLLTNVSTKVLDMALDSFQGQADEITKLMEASVQPYLGKNINTYV
ncbi:MAG: YjfB family protein [Lachnospiraceae bacterium]|nr:YjfB family protein [Lachnospiraceae bacterium]